MLCGLRIWQRNKGLKLMISVLFVCLGNICRSPMAEGIMRQKIKDYDLDAMVDSCGTANYHVGESPDRRGIQTLHNYDIDISNLQGRQFHISDFDHFNFIFTMDTSNYENIIALARNEKDKAKVQLLLDETYPGEQRVVPDPYYGGADGFEETYALVDAACESLAQRLSTK